MENNSVSMWFRSGMLLGIVMALSACSSSQSPNYYTLSPQVAAVNTKTLRVIEVMPVGLPDRINRSPIAWQNTQGQLQLLDNERWSSSLDAELRDGLSAGLQQKLGAVDRYSSGMQVGQASYRISTDFSRFDIVEQSPTVAKTSHTPYQIEVVVAWMIKLDDSGLRSTASNSSKSATQTAIARTQLNCRMSFKESVNGRVIGDMVGASRLALNQVVDAVAASVLALESGKVQNSNTVVCS